MRPEIHVNGFAVLASVVASFAIGGVWYGPLFGKTWRKAMGFKDDQAPGGAEIAKGSILNVIGLAFMAFVLAHDVAIWRPSTWKLDGDDHPAIYGFFAGFFLWLGFIVPMLLNSVAFERKSWKVFAIGATYQLISLQTMSMILSFWR